MNNIYKNANEAFFNLYDMINEENHEPGNGTRALYNVGFYILDSRDNHIDVEWRKWNLKYATREWLWYLSENRSVEEIKKFAPIWDKMHYGDNIVNSNYGYLWGEKDQLKGAIQLLKKDPTTRRAWITIFDGKNRSEFDKDTPCTLSIGFTIIDNTLCMTVLMRSNDIWYGFCNDQYCFSRLHEYVGKKLKLKLGWYYHFAADMHVYEKHYKENLKIKL